MCQNYSLAGLLRHTNYIVSVAAKNLEGLGPAATIELRTEDGGICAALYSILLLYNTTLCMCPIKFGKDEGCCRSSA